MSEARSSGLGSGGRISAAVRVNGELRPVPADFPGDALFPIYSITKTLTALCVLRLAETGSLDDSARRWLPDANIPPAIALTHLLRHTSGLRDYGPLPEYHNAVRTHPDRPWARQDFLDAVLPRGVRCAPGETFSYSNVGYMLLIEIIERVTGQAFARALDEFVVTPLSLQRTSILADIDDLMRCVPGFGNEVTSDGHVVDIRGRYHPGWCAPRVIASTAEDITRVFDGLLAGDVLEPDTLTQMLTLTPLSDEPDEIHGVGMGVYGELSPRRGRNYHHGGGGPGYDLSATVYPDTPLGRVSIAVFVNSSRGSRAIDCEAALLAPLLEHNL
jgi:D-alanyl-D-alanine carboxypeptidase